MINFRFITNIIGKLLFVESAFLILCIFVALIYKEDDLMAFVYSSVITLGVGSLMTFTVKVKDRVLAKKDGYFIVTCTWIIFTLFGCLPFLFAGTIPSVVDAIFETMSGFTTTGSSVVNDVEALPHATLFWRSLTQWMGGMGIIVLLLAILPGLGIEGRDLFVAEVPGPTHDKFTATFKSTARRMWYLYISLTAIQTILLVLGDMDLFDSICHSFSTMATGGYSTKQDSVAYWDSAYIQYVIIIFMFIAGTNFGLLYVVVHGKFRKLFHDEEFKLYLYITLGASAIIAIVLFLNGYANLELSIRESLFQVVTILTTTGFAHGRLPVMASPYRGYYFCTSFYRGMCRLYRRRFKMYPAQFIIQKLLHRDETDHPPQRNHQCQIQWEKCSSQYHDRGNGFLHPIYVYLCHFQFNHVIIYPGYCHGLQCCHFLYE